MQASKLTWPERICLIEHFAVSSAAAAKAFGVTEQEINAAKQLVATGTIAAAKDMDVEPWAGLFVEKAEKTEITKPVVPQIQKPATSHASPLVHKKHESSSTHVSPSQSAARRGRRGSKITSALKAVPTTPISAEKFRLQYGVSMAVLRQSTRFSKSLSTEEQVALGVVHVRKNESGEYMIWREGGTGTKSA